MRMESGGDLGRSVVSGLARVAGIDIPEHPRLPEWVSWTSSATDLTLLRGDETLLPIKGELFGRIARSILPELDGTRQADDLSRLPIEDIQPTTILFFLKVLAAHGFLEPGGPSRHGRKAAGDAELAALLASLSAQDDTLPLVRHLQSRNIGLVSKARAAETLFEPLTQWIATTFDVTLNPDGNGNLDASMICSGALDDELRETDLVIVYASPFDPEIRQNTNLYLLEKAARALYVWQEGSTVYMGPTVIGGYTPCIQCLVTRRTAVDASGLSFSPADGPDLNRDWVWQKVSRKACSVERVRMNARLAAHLLFFEVVKLLSGVAPPATVGAWLEINAAKPKFERHALLRAPRCICADFHPGTEIDAHG